MNADRELLELAAKAAGLSLREHPTGCLVTSDRQDEMGDAVWNPLTDDGDALRLAMRLSISIHMNIVEVGTGTINLTMARTFIKEDMIYQDTDIATRRAIVRAAAEIGKAML
jgi:hypothetical protein